MIIKINGIEYVEKNYDRIIFSKWSPKAFVIGFLCGFVIAIMISISVGIK